MLSKSTDAIDLATNASIDLSEYITSDQSGTSIVFTSTAGTISGSHNAYDDYISGPTAQSTNNDWQYFEVNADRSSATLLSNWQIGNGIIDSYGQWDNNNTDGDYPFVQKVTADGLIYSNYNSSFTGPALIMHTDSSTTNVCIGYKNNSDISIRANINIVLSLLFPVNNSDGVQYYIQRGLINDIRYIMYATGILISTETYTFETNMILGSGEIIYLMLNNNHSYNWDHTRVVFNATTNKFLAGTTTGPVTITANQSGNDTYLAALPITMTVNVTLP